MLYWIPAERSLLFIWGEVVLVHDGAVCVRVRARVCGADSQAGLIKMHQTQLLSCVPLICPTGPNDNKTPFTEKCVVAPF